MPRCLHRKATDALQTPATQTGPALLDAGTSAIVALTVRRENAASDLAVPLAHGAGHVTLAAARSTARHVLTSLVVKCQRGQSRPKRLCLLRARLAQAGGNFDDARQSFIDVLLIGPRITDKSGSKCRRRLTRIPLFPVVFRECGCEGPLAAEFHWPSNSFFPFRPQHTR